MGKFTLTQLFMGVWLIAILIGLLRAEGCGRRFEKISCVAFSPDGTRLAVAKHDARHANVSMKLYLSNVCRTVSVLQVPTLTTERVVEQDLRPGNQGPAFGLYKYSRNSLGFLADSQTLAVLEHAGGEVRAYDLETSGEHALTRSQVSEKNLCLSADRSKACTGLFNRITIWDLSSNRVPININTEDQAFADCPLSSFSPDGLLVATAGDLSATLFDSSKGTKIVSLKDANKDDIVAIEFSPNGEQIAVVSRNCLQLYDLQGECVSRTDFEIQTTAARYLPNGKELVVAGGYSYDDDATVSVLDLAKPDQRRMLFRGPTTTCLESSPDGTLVAIGDVRGMVTLLDAQSGKILATTKPAGHTGHAWPLPVAFLAAWGLVCRWLVSRARARARRDSSDPIASLVCRIPSLG